MEQEPLQIGQHILREGGIPRGGKLLIFLVPILLLLSSAGIVGFFSELFLVSQVSWMPWVLAGATLFCLMVAMITILSTFPAYIRFAKKGEEAVMATAMGKELYVNALMGSGLGFWEHDLSNRKAFFSARMMSMLGYPDKDRFDSMDFWYDAIHPDDREGVRREMEYYLDGRMPEYSTEYRLRRATGEYLWVMDTGKALRDLEGKPLKLSGVIEDISNVKRAQEVLSARTSELESAKNMIEAEIHNVRKFQKAVDSSTEAVSITESNGTIIYVNPAWTILNGYSSAEAMGRNTRLLKSAETKPAIFSEMWEKISSGYPYHTEDIVNKRRDGSTYVAELSIFPISEGKETLFYVSLCQDISLRKEVDRAKTEFVSLASHQLRTPLSAIRWYSEMLLSQHVGDLNDKQRQYAKEIYAENLRMVELVNALLNVSRLDLGTLTIEPETVNPVEICESVLQELAPQIMEKRQLVTRLFVDAPKSYVADPKLIRIIFQNFLSNSVKYTGEKGTITVEIGVKEKSFAIRVSDNGYGIPKNQQAKIFQKLFRADNVRQKDTEGTGLGLYIVKAIVESAGGQISFESEENHGTTFRVLLPLGGMRKQGGVKGLI